MGKLSWIIWGGPNTIRAFKSRDPFPKAESEVQRKKRQEIFKARKASTTLLVLKMKERIHEPRNVYGL